LRDARVNYFKVPIQDGLRSTLVVMRELERIALSEPSFRQWIKNNFASTCGVCQLKKVWQYVRSNFKYLEDNYDEVIISPAIIIQNRVGDCDDFALFIHTVFTALNIDSKYILFGAEKNKPTHIAVYAMGTIVDGTNFNFNTIPKKYRYYNFA